MVVRNATRLGLTGLLTVTLAALFLFGGEEKSDKQNPADKQAATQSDKQTSRTPDNARVDIEPRVRTAKPVADPAAKREPSIRVDTTLVLINVTVTDPM